MWICQMMSEIVLHLAKHKVLLVEVQRQLHPGRLHSVPCYSVDWTIHLVLVELLIGSYCLLSHLGTNFATSCATLNYAGAARQKDIVHLKEPKASIVGQAKMYSDWPQEDSSLIQLKQQSVIFAGFMSHWILTLKIVFADIFCKPPVIILFNLKNRW